MSDDNDKISKIDDLKSKLFSRNYETRMVHHEHFSEMNDIKVKDNWSDNTAPLLSKREQFFMQNSFFKKFFIFSVIFLIGAIIFAGFSFFYGNNTISNDNIEISVLGSSFATGGEELPLVIEIENKNNSAMLSVDLIAEYSKDAKGKTERSRLSLGDISSNSTKSQNISLVLFGEQGTINKIKFEVEYRIANSNAILVKEKYYEVTINSTPINLSIDAPSDISPNEEITLKTKVSLNGSKVMQKVLVRVDYPIGFQFSSSIPAPTFGNNTFFLGDLSPGVEQEIIVKGKMVDVEDGEEKSFRVWSGTQSSEDKKEIAKVLNSFAHIVLIKRAFIEARISIGNTYQKEYTVESRDSIQVGIDWANNLDTKVSDFEIRAKLSGNVLDRKRIVVQDGFYDSATDEIIWDKNSYTKFKSIEPGETGGVYFSLSSLPLFSSFDGLVSSPSISISSVVSGRQALEGNINEQVKSGETKVIKIITDMSFAVKSAYNSTLIKNTGPIPPKVGKETSYTITWSISNTANSISKAEIRSKIPSWIKWKGVISPSSESITYDQNTREIVWNAGRVNRGAGLTTTAREVSFQLSFTPSLSQVDTSPNILSESILTAHDDFANVDLRATKSALTTKLNNDNIVSGSSGVVVE